MSKIVECTPQEKMVVYSARQLKPFEGQQALIGIGLPTMAAQLAKKMWSPNLSVVIENGSFDINLSEIPFSLFGARLTYGCSAQLDNGFALSGPKRGRVKVGFIGAAQVDKNGNVNTTHIGPIEKMKARIAGSGGAVDIGCFCPNTFIVVPQNKRTFVERVDYVTTPGWIVPDNSTLERKWVHRKTLGLPGGPRAIITNLGIMKFKEESGEAYLEEYYAGISPEQVLENTGFNLDISQAREAEPVTEEELQILRTQVDPLNLYKTRK